jgi:hypothetical protein
MRLAVMSVVIATAALVWNAAAAQQEMRSTPGPGSGIMNVAGTVNVGNVPDVYASQRGAWKVDVSSTPAVTAASLPFVAVGSRYLVIWQDGGSQTVTIAASGPGGWVRVNSDGQPRWVNLAVARAVEAR